MTEIIATIPPPSTAQGVLRLRPPRERVDHRAVAWWTAQSALTVVPVLVVLVACAAFIGPARFWLLLAAAVVGALGLAYVLVMPRWRYRVHRWEVTEDAVYTASGWLWQEWRVAPMSRIQTVDSARGPVQRMFGLTSVIVTTASAAGPISIHGLTHWDATDVVDRLTEITQQTQGDAT